MALTTLEGHGSAFGGPWFHRTTSQSNWWTYTSS